MSDAGELPGDKAAENDSDDTLITAVGEAQNKDSSKIDTGENNADEKKEGTEKAQEPNEQTNKQDETWDDGDIEPYSPTTDRDERNVTGKDFESPMLTQDETESGENSSSPENTQNQTEEETENEELVFKQKLTAIEDISITFEQRIETLKELIDHECSQLSNTPLKDYSRLEYLKQVITSSNNVCQTCEDALVKMNANMLSVNQFINTMQNAVDKKIANEGLMTWADQLKSDPSDTGAVASEKTILAQVAESKSILAEATKSIPKTEARAAELALQAAEAAAQANKAQQEADKSRIAAEKAKLADEKKRQAELEAKKKKEEEEKKKEEEERKRREEQERRQAEMNKLAGTPEERERQRLEAEKRNPQNWPVWIFSCDPGSTGIPVGCVIKAMPGITTRDEFTVESKDQLSGDFKLEENEELVSNIIEIKHSDPKFKSLEPLSIALPQIAQRNTSRECVVKMLQPNGKWIEVSTNEVSFEDMKEYKFVECRIQKVAMLAVVFRIKHEQHTIHKRGGKVVPSVDSRICFTVRQAMFKVSTTVSVEVAPVDSSLVADVRRRKPDCSGLLASSPIVRLETPLKKFIKSIMVNIPLPPSANKAKQRPATASGSKNVSANTSNNRPKSAYATFKTEEDEEETIHLLTLDNGGEWVVVDGMQLVQPKNKDIITFEMENPMSKFIILRTKQEVNISNIERIAKNIETAMGERIVQIVLRQKNDDASNILIQCSLASKIEETIRKLSDKGYEYGPSPSNEIVTLEGQPLLVTFRGNVGSSNSEPIKFVFNSHIKTRSQIHAKVQDTFAQKSIDCYRGFAQIHMITSSDPIQAFADPNITSDDTQPAKQLTGEKQQLVTEQLINLPKPEPEGQKVIVNRATVQVKSDGLVNKDVLQQLASDLGDEWKRLAQYLNVRKVRIQAILRNNADKDTEHAIYEMLLTWIKRVPKSADKVDILCSALVACGRVDLAEVMKDNESDFKRERSRSARDSYLRKAYVKIAQSPHVVSDWKYLARQLELRESEIQEVDDSFTGIREKCFHSLIKWGETLGGEATPNLLLRTLRKCKYHHVAEQVQDILKDAV